MLRLLFVLVLMFISTEGFSVHTCANVTCSQNCRPTPEGNECFCDVGYKLNQDNQTCLDIDECSNIGICSQICTNLVGSYQCTCLDGYDLINNSCRVLGVEPLLIFSHRKEIRGVQLRSNRHFQIRKAVNKAASIDVDPQESRLYWVEISNKSAVYSSNFDGTELEVVLNIGLMMPEDIAVDYVARNLYITDSGLEQILVCKMDGSMCHVLHNTGIEKLRAIALDSPEGLLYWSDYGDNSPGIYRSGMDGTGRIHFVAEDIGWPNGIAVDHTVSRLFWTDGKRKTVEYVTLDGKTRKVLIEDRLVHPYSLAVFEDNIYWSDWNTLKAGNKFSAHEVNVVAQNHGKRIIGVHVYHPALYRQTNNPCLGNPCSHMCLIAPQSAYRCVCPPGFIISSDNSTCLVDDNFPTLFISDETRIYQVRPETVGQTAVTELPITPMGLIGSLAFDWLSRTLFVTDLKVPVIYAINTTTFHKRELAKICLQVPKAIAFDWRSSNLYWVDSRKGTVEVASTVTFQTTSIVVNLTEPVAIALAPSKGRMFISTIGGFPKVEMYDMNGRNRTSWPAISSHVLSLSTHPSSNILYWADFITDEIASINYLYPAWTLVTTAENVTSIAISEKYIYWTDSKHHVLSLRKHNATHSHTISLPGSRSGTTARKVIYTGPPPVAQTLQENISCRTSNGGCSHLCLTSPAGRSCLCPSDMYISNDGITCEAAPACANDKFHCGAGECIPSLWRCDGENDCKDSSDEAECHKTSCDEEMQLRCGHGQCIPKSWACDGASDCFDGTDEKDCDLAKTCNDEQFQCDDVICINMTLVCDRKYDCQDGTDEKNCTYETQTCASGKYTCEDGSCIYHHELCDSFKDCPGGEDEFNCTRSASTCNADEFLCTSNSRCISKRWVCDGEDDCDDGTDESEDVCPKMTLSKPDLGCDEFVCTHIRECLPWTKVCDGQLDCADATDESNLCSVACSQDNGGCSQICQKTPEGSKCSCYNGYILSLDGITCEDVNECDTLGICSHFCNNTNGGYKCSCAEGYFLQQHDKCKADGGPATLVYLLPEQIRGIDLHSRSERVYVSGDMSDMRGMDLDVSEESFFWSDWRMATINKYTVDTNIGNILRRTQGRTQFIRWDWIAKNIYYTDQSENIKCCTENGSFCSTVISQINSVVNSIDISPNSGFMFWSVWKNIKTKTGKIERAELDGSHRIVIVNENIVWPSALTVDHILKLIYWADAKLNVIECADFNGLRRRAVVVEGLNHPLSITLFEDFIYWSDWGTDSLNRCNKFSGRNCTTILHRRSLKSEVMMIFHNAAQPRGMNHCLNSRCPHVCLPTKHSFTCKCDDAYIQVNNTCERRDLERFEHRTMLSGI